MTEAAQQSPASDDISVEELMIRAAESASASLPLLEANSTHFIEAIGPKISEFVGAPVTVELGQMQYTTCGETLGQLGDGGTFIRAVGSPWNGALLLWCETSLIGRLVDTLLGSNVAPAKDKERTFTRLETRLVRQIGQTILDQFANALSDIRRLDFRIAGLDAPDAEAPEWASALKCFAIRAVITQGEVTGQFVLLLPFPTFADDYEALASMPETQQDAPVGTWRSEMSRVLTRTGVRLTAVLGDTRVPLSEALSWREGSTVHFGAGSSDAVRVTCGDHTVFNAIPGRRSNGALALRITSDVEIERIAQND